MNNDENFGTNSILEKIIMSKKAEEVARLDVVEIVNNLFAKLSAREQDVLVRRYGLHGQGRETLENIGRLHQLTRERIRQIETTSIKKIRELKEMAEHLSAFKKVILNLLEEHGGIMERDFLLRVLLYFSTIESKSEDDTRRIHKLYLDFLVSKLLHNDFELVGDSEHFKPSYKLRFFELSHYEEIIIELIEKIRACGKVLTTEALLQFIKGLSSYDKYRGKIQFANTIDLSGILKNNYFEENYSLVNNHKTFYSLLKAAKKIAQNQYGHWGLRHWREITPKTINDKIYLILKNHREPIHFATLAEKINGANFDGKKANPATVHNELILDEKYVLIGRGIYGLKEWGYQNGTVSDVIAEILQETKEPLARDIIIEKVLAKRMVKKATIILALMNKEKFEKNEAGYMLKN